MTERSPTLLTRPFDPRYPEGDNCRAIRTALRKAGFTATLADIHWAWRNYSEQHSAGWLDPGHDYDDAANIVRAILTPETEDDTGAL